MKRLFIGIPIQSVRVFQATETWRTDEKLNNNVLKWVNYENWHLTLVFLGNTPVSEVDLLQQLIEDSFTNIPAFTTNLSGVGVFPNTHNPKVLWLGFSDLHPLMSAHFRLVEMLQFNGFSLENKPLRPHLTLARIKNSAHRISFESLLNHYQTFTFGAVEINRVALYESISTTTGPVYKPLFVKELS